MVDSVSYNLDPPPAKTGKKKTPFIIIAVLLILLLVGGYFYFNRSVTKPEKDTQKEENKDIVISPSPTEIPLDKSKIKIQVLNGTGTPGQASQAVKALTDADYLEENIKTGNADEYDNTETTISYKAGFKSAADDIQEALKSLFSEAKVESLELEENNEFDIIVLTGGEIYEEPSPTPLPTSQATGTPAPTVSLSLTPTVSLTLTPTP